MTNGCVFGENWEGERKKEYSTKLGVGMEREWGERPPPTKREQECYGEGWTSDTKLLFKYSTYSNDEIQYKNIEIY